MRLSQLTLRIDAGEVATVEALLQLSGALAVSLDDAADEPLYEPPFGETPLWHAVVVRGLFPSETDLPRLSEVLAVSLGRRPQVSYCEIDRQDWEHANLQTFSALEIGSRLRLLPAADGTEAPSRTDVRMHMGFAFGTGQHPTTRLCLEWLDSAILDGLEVLDFGCGSGVLAIAALKLGARRAWATDTDPQALAACARNGELNAISDRLWVGPPEDLPNLRADVVMANILAKSLIDMAPRLTRFCRTPGKLVLSGILDDQIDAITTAYRGEFDSFAVARLAGWCAVTAATSSESYPAESPGIL